MATKLSQPTRAAIANNQLAIKARLHVERETIVTESDPFSPGFVRTEGAITYGLADTRYWDIEKQQWLPLSDDPDKFLITGADYETTRAEFWARWKIFCLKRFNQKFIPIDWIQ